MELVTLLTAAVVLAGAVVGYATKLRKEVQEIHVMVNSRMSEALNRIDQLDDLLRSEEIVIPADPARERFLS